MTTEISPLPTVYLDAVRNKTRKPRSKCRLSMAERNVINKYRDEYRGQTTMDGRNDLLRNLILVDIFNYWYKEGIVTAEITAEILSDRIKVVIQISFGIITLF